MIIRIPKRAREKHLEKMASMSDRERRLWRLNANTSPEYHEKRRQEKEAKKTNDSQKS